jgi:hypothetical protein
VNALCEILKQKFVKNRQEKVDQYSGATRIAAAQKQPSLWTGDYCTTENYLVQQSYIASATVRGLGCIGLTSKTGVNTVFVVLPANAFHELKILKDLNTVTVILENDIPCRKIHMDNVKCASLTATVFPEKI